MNRATVKTSVRLMLALASALLWVFGTSPSPEAQRKAAVIPTKAVDAVYHPLIKFFEANCADCHNSQLASGKLNLEKHQTRASVTDDREIWEHILLKLQTGEMPPKGMPRPDSVEVAKAIAWIQGEIERSDRLAKPDPGRVTARRLNRTEYDNTIRDLLAVDFRPAEDFPQDDSGYGFDNIGDVLSLSPALMEKYLAASERVARTALFGPEKVKPVLIKLQVPGRRVATRQTALTDYDLTGLSLPNALHVTHRFPVTGEYVIKAILGGTRPGGSEAIRLDFWVDGQLQQTVELDPDHEASFEIDRQDLGSKVREFRAKMTAGEHWIAVSIPRLYEGLPAKYGGLAPSKRPEPPQRTFRPPPNVPPERIEELRKQFEAQRIERDRVPANDARIGAIEIGGPYTQESGPSLESLKKIYVCGHLDGHHTRGCARRILTDMARRAFRRPVTRAEVEPIIAIAADAERQENSFAEGIAVGLQAILVSPHFLFRIETNANATAAVLQTSFITQYALASRLSYFLWSSMPDAELLACAERGVLRDPAVLERQVHRMLKDAKSRALVDNFGGQWLELRKLESVKPDRQRFPEFEEYLRMSMREETELFFDDIVRNDRSILRFIDADYSFLNERLARFYRIPGVTGTQFRRVSLVGSPRGGILTQASVLTVSSYATRTSPVLRGKWLLDNILNAPPPPPPPGVPNLDEKTAVSSASVRLQLEEHRKNTTCSSCHARMDPLGFGLENFDAIGAWRDRDGKIEIDSSGTLPDGRAFKGPSELRAIVKTDRESFAECLTEKMLTYGLGRGLERYDRPVVKKIVRGVAASDYRFSALVLEIARSLPFQRRRGI